MKHISTYYAGGARVMVDGIPIRLARKPSPTNLADMREDAKWAKGERPYYYSRGKIREMRKAEAKHAIEIYAATLGISKQRAMRKILRQRDYIIANPLVDLSLEYDL